MVFNAIVFKEKVTPKNIYFLSTLIKLHLVYLGLAARDSIKSAASEVEFWASFETNFLRIASTLETETSVSGKAECLLAIGGDTEKVSFSPSTLIKVMNVSVNEYVVLEMAPLKGEKKTEATHTNWDLGTSLRRAPLSLLLPPPPPPPTP